jgi:hypothetical protein
MIPHRTLSSEICGNGLRNRVTACRKGLRVTRIMHKSHLHNQPEELFSETEISPCEFLEDRPAMRESLVRIDCSPEFELSAESGADETLVCVGEQEVGIT